MADVATGRAGKDYLKHTKNPSADYVEKFLEAYPDLSAEWLMRGCGSMTLDDAPSSGVPTPTEDSAVLNEPGMDAAQTIITLRAQISQLLATIASQQQTIASQQDTISTLCNTNSQK